ncbi:MAG: class I SAM-dependent methyltransferase [Nanoarchaeota archaeon]|nr:MAG: class I SAM-dependent methyltransferase [Nanoarchaeota archaeon]
MNELLFSGERLHPKQDDLNAISYNKQYHFVADYLKGKVVLDNACGNGLGSQIYLRKAKELFGIDISKEAVENARKLNPRGSFKAMDAIKLEIKQKFDAIVSFATLEHIKEYKKYLSECKRVLKPKGILIIETPNVDFYSRVDRTSHFHETEFSSEGLREALEQSGFTIREFWGVSFSQRARSYISRIEAKRKNPLYDFLFKIYLPLSIYIPKGMKSKLRKSVSKAEFNEDDVIISKELDKAHEFIVIANKA